MDVNQQKIACGIIVGVAIFSTTLGFLSMFAIAQSSLSMMSRLNRNPIEDEKFLTEEIFERINTNMLQRDVEWLSKLGPHPGLSSFRICISCWEFYPKYMISILDFVCSHTVILEYFNINK